jgi:carboxyl-terminal processing protease
VQKLPQVWDALSKDYFEPVDEDRMIEFAAAAMADSIGDVYTTYYTKEEMRMVKEHSAGVFHGIGVTVITGENGRLRITGFVDGSPAEEAGVLIGDEVVSVDGIGIGEIGDPNMVIGKIKGEAGVGVTVGFFRPSDGLEHEFFIERREIKTENILSDILYMDGDMPIGYIYIKMFDGAAYDYFERHLDRLLESGIEALVVDLRGNPGGDFEETVKIADRLIGEGIIVYTEDRAGRREYRRSDARALDMPLRVLIDAGSASASEILAGAIKDQGAGRLIGEKTFGKGIVQAVMTLSDGSGLKYTRSRYFTPSGVCIDGGGIEPDILVDARGPDGAAPPRGDIRSAARGYLPGGDVQLETALEDIEIVIDKAEGY